MKGKTQLQQLQQLQQPGRALRRIDRTGSVRWFERRCKVRGRPDISVSETGSHGG